MGFPMTDIANNSSTTTNVSVGGSVASSIETIGDHDWIRVHLVAGHTYQFTTSAGISGAEIGDTIIDFYDANGNYITYNDEYGNDHYSKFGYTAKVTGDFYIDVSGYQSNVGSYTLSVTEVATPPVYTNDQIATQLTTGFWNYNNETPNHHFNVVPGGTITVNLNNLTAEGIFFAHAALAAWHDATGINFTEVAGTATAANIMFDDSVLGSAYETDTIVGAFTTSASINIGTDWIQNDGTNLNSYSYQTYIHEIGHALGLGHGGNYNGAATFGVEDNYLNDSWQATVMSYFSQQDNTWLTNSFAFIMTPMMADLIAVAALYGASTTTHLGATVYGFNSTAGNVIYDAAMFGNVSYTVFDNSGVDTLDYSGFSQNQRIDLHSESYSDIGGLIGNVGIAKDTVIENAIGGSGNDELIGNSVTNTLTGGAGNDTYYVDGAADIVREAVAGGTDTVFTSVSYVLTAAQEIENFATTSQAGVVAINLTGNSSNNVIDGNNGVNSINGGLGADTMRGHSGSDLYYVDNLLDIVTEGAGAAEGTLDVIYSSISFTNAANVERLTLTGAANIDATGLATQADYLLGNAGINTLTGLGGNDTLNGGTNGDIMIGGDGNDVYYVDNALDVVTEAAGVAAGTLDFIYSSVSFTNAVNVERLALNGTANIDATGLASQADYLLGNVGINTLTGLGGNDTLDGGANHDTMIGGDGNDLYYVDNVLDVVTEAAGAAAGTLDVIYSSISFTNAANVERLTLTGAANIDATGLATQADYLLGNAGINTLTGLGGNDTLDGGANHDIMIGGDGNDIYYVDNALDVVTEAAGAAAGTLDIIYSSISFTNAANVERLTLTGTANIDATGLATQADYLLGNAGVNTLYGLGGNDTLNGGTNHDIMIGGDGNDVYYVDNALDVVTEAAGVAAGTLDFIYSSVSFTNAVNVERLGLNGTANVNATGLSSQADYLLGNVGNNILNGMNGNDTLSGGLGNDIFRFDTALSAAANVDNILDFNVAADTIQLENSIFTLFNTIGGIAANLFKDLTTGGAQDADDVILYNETTGALSYDADGLGGNAATQFATLTNHVAIFFDDFIVT
jgi:serralysin